MEKARAVVMLYLILFLAANLQQCSRADNTVITSTYYHDFFVKYASCTRLCDTKNILTVNGQFPGPSLHVQRLDALVVNVYNQADHNITIHWHGVRQQGNPWSDGAAYITQCPIQPGRNFTYRISTFASEEGTLWWHAHSHVLRATVHGAIIVYPRQGTTYPFKTPDEEVPIILGEWWKRDVIDVYQEAKEKGEAPMPSDAYTINGWPGYLYPCSISDTFNMLVEQGKTYLIRIISATMDQQLFFAISGHRLTLVAVDGSYTKPLTTDYIMISPGQTMDILVGADQPPDRYITAAGPYDTGMGSMDSMPTNNVAAIAFFDYIHHLVPVSFMPMVPFLPSSNDSHSSNNFTSRIRGLKLTDLERDILANVEERMFIVLSTSMSHMSSMNNVSFVEPRMDVLEAYYNGFRDLYSEDFPSDPPRKFNYTGLGPMDEDWPPESGTKVKVLDYGKNMEIVFQATNIMAKESHPMHLHGHSFYVVGWGFGNFDPDKDPLRYNLVDPTKQSSVMVPRGGWATIRFKANNPGVWMLHCHYEHHHYRGMSMAFVVGEGEDESSELEPPPMGMPAC